jgi:hypothetical protein
MSEVQTIEISFRGERLGSYVDNGGTTWTLYRMDYPSDGYYYRIHASDEDGAWMESGQYSNGLEDFEVLGGWPKFTAFLLA